MTTLATSIRTHIESWLSELLRTNELPELARTGRLPARALASYLESIRYLLQHSERNIVRAQHRSQELGLTNIAQYFARKVGEEHGHAQWAETDLSQLPVNARAAVQPASAIVELIEHQNALLARHPICFVGYALWAEYVTAFAGDAWLDALAGSGFARAQVTVIDKHLSHDREHAAEGFNHIDRLWTGDPDAATIVRGVTEASRIFESFCGEIVDVVVRAA